MTTQHWMTLLEAAGEDRENFLQGQLTQDLGTLTARTPVRFAASCEAKGRVLAVLTLIRVGEALYIAMRSDRVDDWLAHVLRYRLRARVDIKRSETHAIAATPASTDWGPLGDAGGDADPLPARWTLGGIDEVVHALGDAPADAVDDTAWRAARIAAGIADVGPAAAGQYTPHMLSLDRIGAISFSKGCYTGQEIVARTEHLGKVKRRARHVRVDRGALSEGAELLGDGGSVAGKVAVCAADRGLAVLPADAAGPGLRLDDGRAVTIDAGAADAR